MNGKSKLWALALLVGVLVLGGAAGAMVDRTLADEPTCPVRESRRESARDRRAAYIDWLTAELELSESQGNQVRATVERHRERVSALWREMRPEFETMKADLRAEIRDVLTEEQREKYEQLLQSERERWRHGKRGRGGR